MKLDPNPLFRRIIMPWYDRTPLCWVLLVFMVGLILFSTMGIIVALESPAYFKHQWIPWLLLAMSLFVGLSVSSRLYRRYHQQHKDIAEP
jgi:hypothetical protein